MVLWRQHWDERRDRVDSHLRGVVARMGPCPAPLRDAIEYTLLAPGKRLRPLLTILAAEASGGGIDKTLPAACAIEMVHTYSLVHDDLPAMDDDDLRRGRPTAHKKFGEALAILTGDALLTWAFQILADSYPAPTACGCIRDLAGAAGFAGMVGGQADDLTSDGKIAASTPPVRDPATLDSLHGRKTGALFRASLRLGLWSAQGELPAGPDGESRRLLDDYGISFGLAFQITDDLLDVEGDASIAGKGVRKDASRGKLTYPELLGTAESRQRVQELVRRCEQAVKPLDERGEPLAALVRELVNRNR